jgi:hypothetical protein
VAVDDDTDRVMAVALVHSDGSLVVIPVDVLRTFAVRDDGRESADQKVADAAESGWRVAGEVSVRWIRSGVQWLDGDEAAYIVPHPMGIHRVQYPPPVGIHEPPPPGGIHEPAPPGGINEPPPPPPAR